MNSAPHDAELSGYILRVYYKNHPTNEQAEALFHASLPYNIYALTVVANTLQDQPSRYEELMNQAAKVSPAYYFEMGKYFQVRKDDDTTAKYFEMGRSLDADAVTGSYYAPWLVRYYLKKGDKEKSAAGGGCSGGSVFRIRTGVQGDIL